MPWEGPINFFWSVTILCLNGEPGLDDGFCSEKPNLQDDRLGHGVDGWWAECEAEGCWGPCQRPGQEEEVGREGPETEVTDGPGVGVQRGAGSPLFLRLLPGARLAGRSSVRGCGLDRERPLSRSSAPSVQSFLSYCAPQGVLPRRLPHVPSLVLASLRVPGCRAGDVGWSLQACVCLSSGVVSASVPFATWNVGLAPGTHLK